MKGFLKKAKSEVKGFLRPESTTTPQQPLHPDPEPQHLPFREDRKGQEHDQPSSIREPTALDILRYRYHHGTNLGSVFVLERWLTPSLFPDCPGSSELEAVKAWVKKIGLQETIRKFTEHWSSAVTDADIYWLANDSKCTTVRLPIGYYDLGDEFTCGTPFERYQCVYANAWFHITDLISRLRANSLGVIIDLHALPGGANPNEHSGTNSGVARLWSSKSNRRLAVRCCQFIAEQVKFDGLEVAGIQIVNEADWDSPHMYEWYDECITAISMIDSTIPVIISDAWELNKAIDYALKKNAAYPQRPTCPVVIDTHYYWAFSDADKAQTPQQIIAEVQTKLSELNGKEGRVIDRGAVQTIVGEYSCVLTEESWTKCGGVPKGELVIQFGHAQSKQWQQRSGGSFFWTWKMDWYPGGEWGFAAQTMNGAIMPHPIQRLSSSQISTIAETARQCKEEYLQQAVSQHVSYWSNTAPNMGGEHWRFEEGWKLGYQDAMVFFEGRGNDGVAGANKIGNLEIWVLKRIRESGFRGGFVWEFEQGLRKGIQDFYAIVGV